MATKYDMVYYWVGGREHGEWVGVAHSGVDAKALKSNLEKQGHVANLGLARIGPPEGAPLRRRFEEIGIFLPTRSEVENLRVGELAPDCFGKLSPVVEIQYRGVDINGRAYVGYTTAFGPNSTVSGNMKEGRIGRTVALSNRLKSAEIDAIQTEAEARPPTAR